MGHIKKRTAGITALTLTASLLFNVNISAAAENRITVIDTGFNPAGASVYEATGSERDYYDHDFNGKEGNLLLAVNPEPWYCTDEKSFFDPKIKELGYLEGTGTSSLMDDKEGSIFTSGNTSDTPFVIPKCGTMSMMEKHPSKDPAPSFHTSSENSVEYKVGDVILRAFASDYDENYTPYDTGDYELTTDPQYHSRWIARVYQCVYTGEVSTIWGYVPYINLTEDEKRKLEAMDEALMKNAESGTDESKNKGYQDTGIIGRSDDPGRTIFLQNNAPSISFNETKINEFGDNTDKYVKKQKEYTGDYLVCDKKYGDNDGKAAFLVEPMNPALMYGGYFNYEDLYEQYMGNQCMDCLHIDFHYGFILGDDIMYSIILHELQHCIRFGYFGEDEDQWIDEWLAQAVSMQVLGQDRGLVNIYINYLTWGNESKEGKNNLRDHCLIKPFSHGRSYSSDTFTNDNLYYISYPLSQYFIEHVDKTFVKTCTEKLPELNSESVSNYLKSNTAHSLQGWIALFEIALTAGIDGTKVNVEKGSDLEIGDSTLIKNCLKLYADNQLKVNNALLGFDDLKKGKRISGGGECKGFKSDKDRTVNLLESEKGVVYALRNSKGEIVAVEGLDTVDKMDKRTFITKNTEVEGSIPLTLNIKMLSNMVFQGKVKPDADTLDLRLYINFKNPSDKDKVNISKIGIKSLTLKNTGAAFNSGSSSNMKKSPVLKRIQLKCLPGAGSAEKDLVKAINKAIKESFKNEPLYFDIYPCPVDSCSPVITLKKDNSSIRKVFCFFGDKKYRFKKTDFEAVLTDNKVTGITGKGNFTGTWSLFDGDRVTMVSQ